MGNKLMLILVGLPARGKSTLARRLRTALAVEDVQVSILNNGDLRRKALGPASSLPGFYDPDNSANRELRDGIALQNVRLAKNFFAEGGQVAILDGTNADKARRERLERELEGISVLYIECINNDQELLEASIVRKSKLPEFEGLSQEEAVESFKRRIDYYAKSYEPLRGERNYLRVNTLYHRILAEKNTDDLPYYPRIRDVLVSPWIRNLFLIRHGQTEYNACGRLGGDSSLTAKGQAQAQALSEHFRMTPLRYIFTSTARRSLQTAEPISRLHPEAQLISLPELNEINAGVCEHMRYEDIQREMPDEFAARATDKYNYIYPQGEGYVTLRDRVYKGLRKALFLAGDASAMMMVGHQAINRMLLSYFLYRRDADVPHIYIPQDQYYHITNTQHKKLFELVRFIDSDGATLAAPRC